MAEPIVLDPTIETDEIQDLSQYLEDLAYRQVMSREIAKVFNRLPNLQLQKDAVARFQAGQKLAAWRIVLELQHPSTTSFFQGKSRVLARGLGIAAAFWLAWIYFFPSQPVPAVHKIHPAAPAKIVRAAPAVQHPAPAATPVLPHKTISTAKNHPQEKPRPAPAAANAVKEVPVPTHLEVHSLSRNETLLVWHDLGKGYTYTVYAAEDLAMHDLSKVHERIPANSYVLLRKEDSLPPAFTVAITATDFNGRESDLSETLRVKL